MTLRRSHVSELHTSPNTAAPSTAVGIGAAVDVSCHEVPAPALNPASRQTRTHSLSAAVVILLVSFSADVVAQTQTAEPLIRPPEQTQPAESEADVGVPPAAEVITTERLDQIRKQIESATELDEDTKKKLLDTHQKAVDALARAARMESQTPLDQAAISGVASAAKEIQTELAMPQRPLLEDIPEDASLADLTAALASLQPKLQDAKQKLTALEAEPGRRVERRAAIAGDQATHANRKAELEKDLAAPAPTDEQPAATMVRRAFQMARLREVAAEAPALQAELSKFEAEKAVDLTSLRIQRRRKEVTRLQQEVEQLTSRIALKRSKDARHIADELQKFATGEAVPSPFVDRTYDAPLFSEGLVKPGNLEIATTTAQLARNNSEITSELADATSDLSTAVKKLESLRSLKARTKDKIKRVGLTGAVGLELRRQMRNLTDPHVVELRCRQRQDQMRDLEFTRLDIEDQARVYSQSIDAVTHTEDRSDSESVGLRLASDRYSTLSLLGRSYGEYFNRLGELDATEQELIREVVDYQTFIGERVLWIRSDRWPGREDVRDGVRTVLWFVSPANWKEVSATLWNDAIQNTWVYALISLLFAVLVVTQTMLRRNMKAIGEVAAKPTCREFYPTIRACVLTIVLALTWPVIPAFAGWRLLSSTDASPFALAVGQGLLAVTAGALTLNLMRQLCRPAGLGLAHFDWPPNSVRHLRLRIHSLLFLLLPLLFIEATLHASENNQGRSILERFLFVISLLVLAWFQFKVMHPRTGVFREYLATNSSGWFYRFRWIVYGITFGIPLALAALAVAGWFYTAYELSWRLHVITWVLIVLLVIRAILIRGFVVSHRGLRIDQARQRRQQLALEQQADPGASQIPKPSVTENQVDLQEVSEQTKRFIDSGLAIAALVAMWFVWVDVLPALGILDRWELWPTTTEVTVEFTEDDGRQSFRTEPQIESVTVADALIAAICVLLTFTAARNIPGLLEMTLLQRLPLEPASRYAARMIARYVIVVFGIASACGIIGIGWAQVQWLVAALTVGLGFGLQEIFANFVSGLIILFERPVRIGDVVTIGDVSGTVSRIQIRATTITDWDRKEYIVPNKEFVTGRLLNWTLSDQTNRIVINVGVAYGTDTVRARTLLLEAATEHGAIMEEPAPLATFEGFGDSCLNLILRAYLPNLDERLKTITELHEVIDRKYRDAGIEISFPQRDLHLRTVPDKGSPLTGSESNTANDIGDQE